MTPEEIKIAIDKLNNLVQSSKFIEAKEFAYELLENQAFCEMKESLGKVYHGLGVIYTYLSEYSKAIEYLNYSLALNIELENKLGIASNLSRIGIAYWYTSDYQKSLENTAKALQIYEEIGEKSGIAGCLLEIGNVYYNLFDYPTTIEFYSKALHVEQEIENKEGIASVLGNIGVVYWRLSENQKALDYYYKALQFNEEIGNKFGSAYNLGNIGCINTLLFDYKSALENSEKSLRMFEEIGNKAGIAFSLGNIGNVYRKLTDYPKAIVYYTKSIQINEEIGNKGDVGKYFCHIGSIYANKNSEFYNFNKAEKYLNKALLIAEEIGAKDVIKEVYDQFHELRRNEEIYKEALDYKLKSIELEKEIQSTEAKKQADNFHIQRKIAEREIQMAEERGRLLERESILRNILPDSVTDRLVNGEKPIADHIETASVLFMDLVGFTSLASIAPPKQLVYLLDAIFQKADEVVETFGLEKIKTIGDGYLAVANVTSQLENHQKATALAALQLLETMKDFTVNIPNNLGDTEWINDMKDLEIRVGIHTGEVVAGIIGKNKFTYDLWGDAVNVASRMESNSEAGRIHISEEFAKSIESYPEFSLISRGEITIKGKGTMKTFWLEKGK